MNSSRYIIARLFLSFGWHRKTKWLTEAADETHLLKQAEEILGEDVWENVENIEAVSVEYWNIRKLKIEVDKLKAVIQQVDKELHSTREDRNQILSKTNQACQALEEERLQYIQESEKLIEKRDQMIAEAKSVKRQYDAANTKIQVLLAEGGGHDEVIFSEKQKIEGLKVKFAKLKEERELIGVEIQKVNQKIQHVEEALGDDQKRLREEASNVYHEMGKANRDISKLASELAMIEQKMQDYYAVIGKYVSIYASSDSECAEIAKKYHKLLVQMQSLRTSIELNHKLASMATT